ncbi:MAG: hypothetical protein ACR2PO_02960 [Methyloligellaceae bacterium]
MSAWGDWRSLLRCLALGGAAILTVGFAAAAADRAAEARRGVTVHIFWEATCPYCQRAKSFLGATAKREPWIEIDAIEVSSSERAQSLFVEVNRVYGIQQPLVPLIVVGSRPFLGYDGDETTGQEILSHARKCRNEDCADLIVSLVAAPASAGGAGAETKRASPPRKVPETIDLPLFGTISTHALSLPLLTVVLAAVDGFNPCAMWVLVFLIGLLVGMQDRVRMWILGTAFLVASAAVYFVFMAAWLNLFLLLGALLWIRVAIGVFALGSGAYYLREFAVNTAAECKVTSPGRRQRIMASLKHAVQEERFLLALGGIVVLAAAVNLIELLCSAGIPAVFTSVLALSDLPVWQH